jgi:hypothetical protein
MKRIVVILMAMMAMQSAKALIVSVDGEGEVPAEGMDLLITEGEEDVLSGKYTMELSGTVLGSASQLTVQIYRSANGLEDEFCCGINCTAGNGEQEETKVFTVSGVADWYSHYVPAAGSDETIRYVFDDGAEQREIRVHYVYAAEGIEKSYQQSAVSIQKVLREGKIVIRSGEKLFDMNGKQL